MPSAQTQILPDNGGNNTATQVGDTDLEEAEGAGVGAVAVRLDRENKAALDYYLLPWIDLGSGRLSLSESNGSILDGYRFDGLETLYHMAERASVRRAA